MAGLDTLSNVENLWSIMDIYDAHEALDIKAEAERYYIEQARSKQ